MTFAFYVITCLCAKMLYVYVGMGLSLKDVVSYSDLGFYPDFRCVPDSNFVIVYYCLCLVSFL